jgi:aspartate/glutamate racemase
MTPTIKVIFIKAARALVEQGAQVIILGSTDPGFITSQEGIRENLLLLNTAIIYAKGIANRACIEA